MPPKRKILDPNEPIPMDIDTDDYYQPDELIAPIEKKKRTTLAKSKENGEKYVKQKIYLPVKTKVWNTYIGEIIGRSKCFCCGDVDITPLRFECGHVLSEANGGDISIPNLRPICSSCNKSMGKTHMVEYMEKNKFPLPANWHGAKEVINVD